MTRRVSKAADLWRAMSPAERLELIDSINRMQRKIGDDGHNKVVIAKLVGADVRRLPEYDDDDEDDTTADRLHRAMQSLRRAPPRVERPGKLRPAERWQAAALRLHRARLPDLS